MQKIEDTARCRCVYYFNKVHTIKYVNYIHKRFDEDKTYSVYYIIFQI